MRVFRGRSVDELVPQIQRELGADAIIVRRREGLTGGVLGFFQRAYVEIEAMPGAPGVDVYDEEDSPPPARPPPPAAARRPPLSRPPSRPSDPGAVTQAFGPLDGQPYSPPPARAADAATDAAPAAARRRAARPGAARRATAGHAVLRARWDAGGRRRRQRVRDSASGGVGARRPLETTAADCACDARADRRPGGVARRVPGAERAQCARAVSARVRAGACSARASQKNRRL